MPLYYKGFPRGYDLDKETPFETCDGKRLQLGSADSFILCCMKCGDERFRDRISPHERCFTCHGPMEPRDIDNDEQRKILHDIWTAKGDKIYSTEELKRHRLEKEATKPWDWIFGDKTETDFPLGYVKDPTP